MLTLEDKQLYKEFYINEDGFCGMRVNISEINFNEFMENIKFDELNSYVDKRINESKEMFDVFNVSEEEIRPVLYYNKFWDMYDKYFNDKQNELEERIKNRFVVPAGKTKKFYNELKRTVQSKISDLLEILREREDNEYAEELRLQYVEMKKKIEFIIKTPKGEIDIKLAKEYPINQLIEFNYNGFAKCPFHQGGNERTPSLKYYKETNSCYCFGECHKSFDSIDAYMNLYNVSLVKAVKFLTSWKK